MPTRFSMLKLFCAAGLGASAYLAALYALNPHTPVLDHWDTVEFDNIIAAMIAACCFAAILWRLMHGGEIDNELSRMGDID